MSKIIMLSRQFMKGHPNAGQPTYFVEKTLNSLLMAGLPIYTDTTPMAFMQSLSTDFFQPKHHTIRPGNRFKKGDKASLRVWLGKPYRSPQIIIAPDVELVVKDVSIANGVMWIDNKKVGWGTVAKNDGLEMQDLRWWFSAPVFSGQMLIWNNNNLPY